MNVWALFWSVDILLLLALPAWFARAAYKNRAPLPGARVFIRKDES
jgi:hypothetical protein